MVLRYDPYANDYYRANPAHVLCSDAQVEPLAGSSRPGSTYLLLEHPGPWSHDILDGGTFSPELTARLQQLDCGLLLIRKPGRSGRVSKSTQVVYVVFCEQAVAQRYDITNIEEVFSLDLAKPAPDRPVVTEPLLLVCTHGKRDRCCAIKGRPIAEELAKEFPLAPIWECSHTKGHRFAPSAILFPWGYFYGRLNAVASKDMYRHAVRDQLFIAGLRGRGIYGPKDQAAQVAVATFLAGKGEAVGIADLAVAADGVVTHKDGRSWIVDLVQQDVAGVMASCGKPEKTGTVWVTKQITDA